jgi:diguanylate cyclase (GGDEF)-like protein/PAS domain S-box-containing protein
MDHVETLEVVLDNSADIILLVNQEGFVEYATPSLERVLGWSVDEFADRTCLDAVHEDDRRRVVDALDHAFDTDSSLGPVERFRGAHADGSWVWLESRLSFVRDRDDVVVICARDITHQITASEQALELEQSRLRAEARLDHANFHDPLTGLPNRHLLADRVEQAIRRAHRTGARSALLFCDIDRFKVVNDALGHTVGDQLLTIVARRLRSCLRETDTVARFGGDEFVILTEDLVADDDAATLAARIHDVLADPIHLNGHTLHATVSTGVVGIDGSQPRDEIISDADTAMYAAKELGRGQWVVFETELRDRASDRLRIEADLRSALDTGNGLAVHVQPEVSLSTRRTVGYEALVRWTLPDGTNMPPDRFLPVAADAGLMHQVGDRVARGVAQALGRLQGARQNSWVALNAAAEELQHPDFAAQVQRALGIAGVNADRLCIEITEHSILKDPAGVEIALRPLRDLGATVAIDDFGTGYSSLSYLTRFRPEYVKIDRSFTAAAADRAGDRAIVEAVIQLAASLAITTVAEGIETEDQARLLTELGCQLGQGWHFGRPAPIDHLLAS